VAYDEDLADRVRAVLPHGEAVTERQMFGGLAFMLGGHMFCGVVKDALMVRFGPEGAGRALGQPHVRPMDFTGRPMKGMVFVDPAPVGGHAHDRARPAKRLSPGPCIPPQRRPGRPARLPDTVPRQRGSGKPQRSPCPYCASERIGTIRQLSA